MKRSPSDSSIFCNNGFKERTSIHEALEKISAELKKVVEKVLANIPQGKSFGIVHNNWSYPGLTSEELAEEAQSLIDLINESDVEDVGDANSVLINYVPRIKFLHENLFQIFGTVPVLAYRLIFSHCKGCDVCLPRPSQRTIMPRPQPSSVN